MPSHQKGERNRAKNCQVPDQFRRLGVAPARHRAGTGSPEHLGFSGRPRRDDRGGTTRSATRPKKARDGSQRIDSLAGSTLLRTEERQELGLSRTAGTHRRRIHAARFTEFYCQPVPKHHAFNRAYAAMGFEREALAERFVRGPVCGLKCLARFRSGMSHTLKDQAAHGHRD